MNASDRFAELTATAIAAVVTLENLDSAEPLARALRAGGVRAIELTFRTACAPEAVRRMRAAVPDMLVGAGTLLSPAQVDAAVEAGASFGVAPGCNPRTIARAIERGLPFAPGVVTPTDIELAVEAGCRVLKFFPCAPSGGLPYLESMAVPFAHLGVRFIPLGGVNAENLETYLRCPLVACVGGSWLAPPDLVEARDWPAIESRARAARATVDRVRGTGA